MSDKKNPKTGRQSIFILLLLLATAFYSSAYVVYQGQQALRLRLGKIITDSKGNAKIVDPGLHFKWPFINQVMHFDVRLQTFSASSSRILTQEQKYVLVDYYTKWKIDDLPLYYTRTGGFVERAETLLQQQINDALRAAFGKRTIREVVSGERMNIMALLLEAANKNAKRLGIQVVDVRIKRIDLPREVSESVFDRMSAQREQVAAQHRANGLAQAEAIKAQADADAVVTIAEAKRNAARIRANGIKKASQIYTETYEKDAKFYGFYRSLQAYLHSFSNKHDILVLQPNTEFFQYFSGKQTTAPVVKSARS